MARQIVPTASINISLPTHKIDRATILSDPEIVSVLSQAIAAFKTTIGVTIGVNL